MIKKLSLIISFVLTTILFAVPVSGTRTIGQTGYYQTLEEACDSIMAYGIDGDIVLLLSAGTYDGRVDLGYTDPAYDITITTNEPEGSVILTNSQSTSSINWIMRLYAANNVAISNLTFQSDATYGCAILMNGDCDDILIDNNVFNGVVSTNTSNHSLIRLNADSEAPDNVQISHNKFYDGAYQIFNSSNTYTEELNTQNLTITDNEFYRSYKHMYLSRAMGAYISDNIFDGSKYGFELRGCKWVDVLGNSLKAKLFGITLSYCGDGDDYCYIYNNKVRVTGANDTYTTFTGEAHGITVSNGTGNSVRHNTVVNTSDHSWSNAMSISGTQNYVKSNLIVNYGKGYGAYFNNLIGDNDVVNIEDYNNIFSKSVYSVKVSNTYYKTLFDFHAAIYIDPSQRNDKNYDPVLDTTMTMIPQSCAMEDQAYYTGYQSFDFYGNPRSNSPDFGAVEYSSTGLAPLSGVFTIGSAGNYTSIQAASDDLTLRGVNGPTQFILDGTDFNEKIDIGFISGTSSINRILFSGSQFTDTRIIAAGTSDKPYVMNLMRTQHVIFEDIEFRNVHNSYGVCFYITSFTDDITVRNCEFYQDTGAVNEYYSNNIFVDQPGEANDFTVTNCTFENGNRAFYDHSYTNSSEVEFLNCTTNNHRIAVNVANVKGLKIKENTINNVTYGGIIANYCDYFEVEKNKITGSSRGIDVSSASGIIPQSPYQNLVANNIINLSGGMGINIAGNYIDILNNSISITGTNLYGIYQYNQSSDLNIFANAIRVENGYVIWLTNSTTTSNYNIDGNSYYSENAKFVKLDNISYNDLQEWCAADPTQNIHSVEADPHFDSFGMATSPWLVNRGFGASRVTEDFNGTSRDVFNDIGANEQVGAVFLFPERNDNVLTVGPGYEYSTIQECFDDIAFHGLKRLSPTDETHKDTLFVRIADGLYGELSQLNHMPREIHELTSDDEAVLVIESMNDNCFLGYPDDSDNQDPIFLLNGIDNVIIRDLNFLSDGSQLSSFIKSMSYIKNCEISGCNFTVTENTNGVIAVNFTDSPSENTVFKHNVFNNGQYGYNVSKEYYSSLYHKNMILHSNVFYNTDYPIHIQNVTGLNVHRSDIYDASQGLWITYCNGLTEVYNNKVEMSGFSGSYTRVTANYMGNIQSDIDGEELRFYNNIIRVFDNTCQAMTGIQFQYCDDALIANNNVEVEHDYSYGWSYAASFSSCPDVIFKNNILSGMKKTYALTYDSNNTVDFLNNCFYSENQYFGRTGSTDYRTFEDFESDHFTNDSNFQAYPFFDNNGFAQSQFLKDRGITPVASFDFLTDARSHPFDVGATIISNNDFFSTIYQDIYVGNGYATLDDAYEALMKRGVSAHINIYLPEGDFSGNHIFRYIPYSSDQSTVTIRPVDGADVTLRYTASSEDDNYVVKMIGTKNLILDGLTLVAEGNTYSRCIDISGVTDKIKIRNCDITGPVITSSDIYDRRPLIFADYDNSFLTTLENNALNNGCYGFSRGSNSIAANDRIENNTFYANYQAINLLAGEGPWIRNNTMDDNYFYSIYMHDVTGSYIISENEIEALSGTVVNIYDCRSDVPKYIFNNYIYGGSDGHTLNGALKVSDTNNLEIVNNTLKGNCSSNNHVFKKDGDVDSLKFINNIVYCSEQGRAAGFSSTDEISECKNNIFYSEGPEAMIWGSTIVHNNAEMVTDSNVQNCFVTDPRFDGDSGQVLSASTAVDNGWDVSYITEDILGNARDENTDMGAYEYIVISHLDSPQNVVISADNASGEVTINWDSVDNADSYKIEISDNPENGFSVQATVTETSYTFTPTTNAGFFKVTAQRNENTVLRAAQPQFRADKSDNRIRRVNK